MNAAPARIALNDWEARYAGLRANGLREANYGGPLGRHLRAGDLRLRHLAFDNSAAALRLWNFLLTEEQRLHAARDRGARLVGAMKDLGTVPVLAWALPDTVAFYPDAAWWAPCMMMGTTGDLEAADLLGVDDSFCPVRALLGAFVSGRHFPRPDVLFCSVGATCDDFSCIAQRLAALGVEINWWEVPHRRPPEPGETEIELPGGALAPAHLVHAVQAELERVARVLAARVGSDLDSGRLAESIRIANRVRGLLVELRNTVFTARRCPLPALEVLIAEALGIHYCSDRQETIAVLEDLLVEVRRRVACGAGVLPDDAVRVFWVNPVADLRALNLLEDVGGRLCGSDFMFTHALHRIPTDRPPLAALAAAALADPMVGSGRERAAAVVREARRLHAEAVVVSRIPGASHCASEGRAIHAAVDAELALPTLEIEVPSLCDAVEPALRTRLEALVETARARRTP